MIFNVLSTTLHILMLTLSCQGDVLSYIVEDLEELRIIPGPKGTLLINITTSVTGRNTSEDSPLQVELKCEREMSSALGSRVITSLDNKKQVLCDTETDGGGWIIIQRRLKGDVDFNRNWIAYKQGFGSFDGDFWIGNEIISHLTNTESYQLRIEMRKGNVSYYANYDYFMVTEESDNYTLHKGSFSGNTSDSLDWHNNKAFSTPDKDNDNSETNCAESLKSGWWYNQCYMSNLNGVWGTSSSSGIFWFDLLADFVEMKIRRK